MSEYPSRCFAEKEKKQKKKKKKTAKKQFYLELWYALNKVLHLPSIEECGIIKILQLVHGPANGQNPPALPRFTCQKIDIFSYFSTITNERHF